MEDNQTKEKIKKSWIQLLRSFEFPEESLEKVYEYAQNHMDYELTGKNYKLEDSTLSQALSTLRKINLNDVEFVKVNDEVKTNVVKFSFGHNNFPDIFEEATIVDEIRNMLIEIQQTKKLYIFMLFSEIKQIEGDVMVFNRFYIK